MTAPDQPVLDPGKLSVDGLGCIHADWRHAVHVYQPCEGLCVNCISGRPGSKWAFRAEGPAAFSVNILLEGRMQTAFDDGAVFDVKAGSTIMMMSGSHARGWNVFDGQTEEAFRMVSVYMPQTAIAGLTGLHMDDVRTYVCTETGDQSHTDAFLGVVPVSSGLRRIACDLLGAESIYPEPDISCDLYLRAKAFEAIACFLRDSFSAPQPVLPVPADRPRLIDARALLAESYDQDWTVPTLARAVGLNEKRLQSGFRALYGCSVHVCLTRIRLDAAIMLLQRGNSVTDTAISCGFASLSHFSRMFRRYSGVSPRKYAMGTVDSK